jgi:hypothetical protein
MRAEKVVKTLLSGATAVTALVGTRIYPGPIPQGTTLPAISYEHISTVALRTLDAAAGYNLVQSRIEVSAVAKTYSDQKSLVEEIRKALDYQRGTIAGIAVTSIIRGSAGPDLRDDDVQLYTQAVDFLVTLREQ